MEDSQSVSRHSHHSTSTSRSSGGMSSEEQDERRKQIKEIMSDNNLSQKEKSLQIQSLMDGRRRSSCTHSVCSSDGEEENGDGGGTRYVSSMAAAAAIAASYYSSDDEGDATMSEADDMGYGDDDLATPADHVSYGYEYSDNRSIASSVTHESASNSNILSSMPSYRQYHGRSMSLQDWNDTDRAAAAANAMNAVIPNPAVVSRLMEQSRPPCQHYERNCTLVSPCCGLAFGCRICHDECPVLPAPLALRRQQGFNMTTDTMGGAGAGSRPARERRRSMPLDFGELEEETHHLIDRFSIREVICRECYERQSSKTNNCVKCGIQFGEYHCNICNLWMSDQENPYHCEACGFCRVGGRENFTHCNDCGMCIDSQLFEDHNCKSGKYMSNCPICQEDLFSSRFASHEMPCGHAIHWHCFKELTSYDTRCPVCKKTAESPEQMQATWSAIAMGIALQPVPSDMARVVNIVCNDCEMPDTNRRWHFLGVRCMNCLSFNTNVEQIVIQGQDAADFLDELEAKQGTTEGGVPANITATNDIMDEDENSR